MANREETVTHAQSLPIRCVRRARVVRDAEESLTARTAVGNSQAR
jgi:hypothetical protein